MNNIDLRMNPFRRRKDYWRAVREGRIIRRYKKPVVCTVKLDPKQAIIQACQVGGGFMLRQGATLYCLSTGGGAPCNTAVRGINPSGQFRAPGLTVTAPS